MSRIYRKPAIKEGPEGKEGKEGPEGKANTFITSVSESFEVVLKELKLKAGAITNAFLGNESVTNEKVKPKSLEGNRLAKETLGNEEIQTNAVDARVIASGAVEEAELGTEAVSTGKIKKEAVSTEKIAKEAVTNTKVIIPSTRTGEGDLNKTATIKNVAESLTEHMVVGDRIESEGIEAGTIVTEVKATELVISKIATITKTKVTLTIKETDALDQSKIVGGTASKSNITGFAQLAGKPGGQILSGGLSESEGTTKPGLSLKPFAGAAVSITLSATTITVAGGSTKLMNVSVPVKFTEQVKFEKPVRHKELIQTWTNESTIFGEATRIGSNAYGSGEEIGYVRTTVIAAPEVTIGGIVAAPEVEPDGTVCVILNGTSKTMTFINEATEVETEVGIKSEVEANKRIITPGGFPIALAEGEMIELIFDQEAKAKVGRWRARRIGYQIGTVYAAALEASGTSTLKAVKGTTGEFTTFLKSPEAKIEGSVECKKVKAEEGKFSTTVKVLETFTAEGDAKVEKTLKVKETTTLEGELKGKAIEGTSGVFTTTLKVKETLTAEKNFEVASGTVKVPEESVTGKAITKETIAKTKFATTVQEELLKIAAPSAFGSYTSAKEETEEKGTFVTLIIKTKAAAEKAVVKLVNSGVEGVFEWDALVAGAQKLPLQFMVKKGGKWTATLSLGAESATISRVTMEP